jgi:hypothetical protein
MPLNAGDRLGQYEVISLLGAGGPPPFAGLDSGRELRRGLAVAQLRRTS